MFSVISVFSTPCTDCCLDEAPVDNGTMFGIFLFKINSIY